MFRADGSLMSASCISDGLFLLRIEGFEFGRELGLGQIQQYDVTRSAELGVQRHRAIRLHFLDSAPFGSGIDPLLH